MDFARGLCSFWFSSFALARFLVWVALVCTSFAAGQILVATPEKDTTMFKLNPHNGGAACNGLFIGTNNDLNFDLARALLKFDLTGIPTNAIVTEANFTFTVIQAAVAGSALVDRNVELHQLAKAWGAASPNNGGAAGASTAGGGDSSLYDQIVPSKNDTATWLITGDAPPQSSEWAEGGAYSDDGANNDVVQGRTLFNVYQFSSTVETYSWGLSSANALAVLQDWVTNPGNNHGWLLKYAQASESGADGSPASRVKIASSEWTGASSYRPTLTVTYTIPATRK